MNNNEKKIEQYLQNIDFDDTPDMAHRDLLEKKLLLNFTAPGTRQNFKWRKIMTNKIAQKAVAAIVIIGVLAGIHHFGGSIDGANVAWADVAEKISNYTKYKCRQRVVRESGSAYKTMDVYHLNLSQRREELENGDIHIMDMRGEDAITVELKPSENKAVVYKLIGFGSQKDPHIIEMVKKFDQESTQRLGTKVVDGKTLQGFRHLPDCGNEFTVWVDSNTKLPVEIKIKHLKSPLGQTILLDEFEFDFKLPPSAFSTKVPAGYEITTLEKNSAEVQPKLITVRDIQSAISHKAYTVNKLNWIKKQAVIQIPDPLGTKTGNVISVLKADDGNVILLIQGDYYTQKSMVWLQKQTMVFETPKGRSLYTHPNGEKYAEVFLKAAAKTVPDYLNTNDISKDTSTIMVAMPESVVVGLVSNKELDDSKLQELVDALTDIQE